MMVLVWLMRLLEPETQQALPELDHN